MKTSTYFLIYCLAILGLCFAALHYYFTFSWYTNALISLNVTGFLMMAVDKALARNQSLRTPENIFFLLAALGASPSILMGMHLFRYKSSKPTFQFFLCAILVAQILLFYYLNRA